MPALPSRSLTSFHRFAAISERSTASVRTLLFFTPFSCRPEATLSKIDMDGNGFGRWNTMPTTRRTATGSTPGAVQVGAVQLHAALDVRSRDHLVHPVQGAQQGRLAASRRADEGGHRTRLDGHRDLLDGVEAAVEDVQVRDIDALGHRLTSPSACSNRAIPGPAG